MGFYVKFEVSEWLYTKRFGPIQLICPLEIKSKMTMEELNSRIRLANKEDILADREQKNERVTSK